MVSCFVLSPTLPSSALFILLIFAIMTSHDFAVVEGLQHHVSKGMIQTSIGSIGYLECNPTTTSVDEDDDGDDVNMSTMMSTPILCFHSSPRSSDEYLEVLPLLALGQRHRRRRVIAFDNPGYGISENPIRSITNDDIADAFVEAADKLQVGPKFVVIGSLMGNFIAVSIASRYPNRVPACIIANLFYYPPKPPESFSSSQQQQQLKSKEEKERGNNKPIPDSFELKDDGTHLIDLHNKRSSWLDPELNFRVIQTEISYLVNRRKRYSQGISIEDLSSYDFETPARTITSSSSSCPILCIRGDSFLSFFDKIGLNGTIQFENGVNLFRKQKQKNNNDNDDDDDEGERKKDDDDDDVEVVALSGDKSTLNMINQLPNEFSDACNTFLEKHNL